MNDLESGVASRNTGGTDTAGKEYVTFSLNAELYAFDELTALAAAHPNFTYLPALSAEPEDSDWQGARGHVHEVAKAHFDSDFRGHKAYLCGPPVMIEACIATLMQGRLFERDIYTEKFFSAADAQQVRSPLFRNV